MSDSVVEKRKENSRQQSIINQLFNVQICYILQYAYIVYLISEKNKNTVYYYMYVHEFSATNKECPIKQNFCYPGNVRGPSSPE